MTHYNGRKEVVPKHTPPLWEYQKRLGEDKDKILLSMFTMWELSFQQIGKNENERMMIGHFLTFSAFFDATNVGEDLFRPHPAPTYKPLRIAELVATAKYKNWKSRVALFVASSRLSPAEAADRSEGSPEVHYRSDNNFDMLQRALVGREKAQGPNHKSTLDTANNLGVLYTAQGRLSDAEAIYQRALTGKEIPLGPNHTSTLRTANNLGNLYAVRGRLADVEAIRARQDRPATETSNASS
ncbi:hypothetical protein FGG08_003099 [Glutinoglossum americanum]|uniref:Kinesin light chain n=1 Tax=Glutinoglossum americanum TaxID=1670608 RepID=A0A9P8IDX5_9PEZI|nr:hypothetical protein FGG08_003099 [Glutinoglossum americanum]